MIKIIEIRENTILVNENGSYYEINRGLLDFAPRVGDLINYTREPGGKILKASLVNNPYSMSENRPTEGRALATVSVVFGSLGFYPLMIIGSIVGIITGLVGIYQNNSYKTRSIIGLSLASGSLLFWIMIYVFARNIAF